MVEKSLQKINTEPDSSEYAEFLSNLRTHIEKAQIRAITKVNSELIILYWHIGREILERQREKGWGAKVIERLSKDLRKEFPEMKGFSTRNLKYMRILAEVYKDKEFVQQLVAQIPWGHNVRILDKVKNVEEREFYIQHTIENGWSRSVLELQIESGLYKRQGKAQTNFERTLPKPQSDLANQLLKDTYNFDFLTIGLEARERELESYLLQNIKEFLLEMGVGFAFVGSQYHLEVGGQDFYIDLLFYHLKLRAFIVIDLKMVDFKPEFAGKMSFYLSAVDDLLKNSNDNPTIGLILCKAKNEIIAEYALRDASKPIGVSTIRLTENLPDKLRRNLPSIEELESLTIKKGLSENFKLSAEVASYGSLVAKTIGELYESKNLSYEMKQKKVKELRKIVQEGRKFHENLKTLAKNEMTEVPDKFLDTFDLLFENQIIKPLTDIINEINSMA